MRKLVKVMAAVAAVATAGAIVAFAGCGGTGTEEAYRFEAEKAVLWADEDEIMDTYYNEWFDMSMYYITGV